MSLIEKLKLTPLYDIYSFFTQRKSYEDWERDGIPVPPPNVVKQHIVAEFAERFSLVTLVETGTYLGEMVKAMKNRFGQLYSIELNEALAKRAQGKFSRDSHIEIMQGDSSTELERLLKRIDSPSLFWLDSHFSGGLTSKGDLETPIMREIALIFAHPVKNHVILIDDARNFVGANDYPTMDSFRNFVLTERPGWTFEVEYDIIRIYPDGE